MVAGAMDSSRNTYTPGTVKATVGAHSKGSSTSAATMTESGLFADAAEASEKLDTCQRQRKERKWYGTTRM